DRLELRGAQVDERSEETGGKAPRGINARVVERTRLGINVSLGEPAVEVAALREIGDATGEQLKGVAITLDGKPVEPFALVDVVPGEHAVKVSADGYFPVEKKQHAVKGASAVVELVL